MSGDDQNVCMFCGCNVNSHFGLPGPGGKAYLDVVYECENCGVFTLEERAKAGVRHRSADERFRIACLLYERRLLGSKGVVGLVDDALAYEGGEVQKLFDIIGLDELILRFPKARDMIDRGLLNLSRGVVHPMDTMEYKWLELGLRLFANKENVHTALRYLQQMELVDLSGETRGSVYVTVTPRGWERIDGLSQKTGISRRAFVAMWYDNSMADIEKAIRNAIEAEEFECRIIKNVEHNNDICDEIVAEIRRSRFVVADFTAGCCRECSDCERKTTCRDMVRSRGGVYFEAGFARGLEIPVIWTVSKAQIEQVHFDVRQYNFIVYETPEDLTGRLRSRIASTIH
jgi:hypothetical protein